MDDRYYNTSDINLNYDGHFCPYCGKELIREEDFDYHDRDTTYYRHCDCKDAQKEHELNIKIKEINRKAKEEIAVLNRQMPKKKFIDGDYFYIEKVDNKKHLEKIITDKKIMRL